MEYKIIRSSRRTMAAEIRGDEVIVRAPFGVPDFVIKSFVRENASRIEEALKKMKEKKAAAASSADSPVRLTKEQINALADKAMKVIPERVKYYAPLVGVTCGRITIRNQRTRWGSCSAKGNLNFNCLLMLAPPEVLDSVVVHELCHRKYMNHSEDFYREVLRVFPEYKKWHKWLKDNGERLMQQNPAGS